MLTMNHMYDIYPRDAERREPEPPADVICPEGACTTVGHEERRDGSNDDMGVLGYLPEVSISQLTGEADLLKVKQELGAKADSSMGHLAMNFGPLTGRNPHRLSPKWGAVLSNLIVGYYRTNDVHVTFPRSDSATEQLARSGILFALSRNPAIAEVFPGGAPSDLLSRWAADWVPADYDEPLFHVPGFDPAIEPQHLSNTMLSFLNPDYIADDSIGEDFDAVTYPWIRQLLNGMGIRDRVTRERLQLDTSRVVIELLGNIKQHSGIDEDGLSSVSLFATGSSERDGRIYLSVFDNGVGMPTTLRNLYGLTRGPGEQIERALVGDLPRRERGRGDGLAAVTNIAQRYNGDLFLATGPTLDGKSIVVDYFTRKESKPGARSFDAPVQGTIIVLAIPIGGIANS